MLNQSRLRVQNLERAIKFKIVWTFVSIQHLHFAFLLSQANVVWQLNEVKRKIALVEGKRRALQSSFERENKGNRAALTRLGEEVQVQHAYW